MAAAPPSLGLDPGTLADLADLALDEARAAGASGYADVRAVAEESESVAVRGDADGDRVEAVGRDGTSGVGVRVLLDGCWGFAATAASGDRGTDGPAVREAARRAVAIARASRAVQRDRVVLDDSPPPDGTYTTPHEQDPLEVPLGEKVALLLATVAAGRSVDDRVSFVEATTAAWRRRTSFRSSEGGRFDQTVLQVGGGTAAYAVGGGEVQRRSAPNSFGGQHLCGGWEAVLGFDLPGVAGPTAREAVALLEAPDLPLREDAVLLLESSQLALQVHESIGHPLELDRIFGSERAYAGTSWVSVEDAGSLRYGSDLVTVVADATTPGALGTFGYDDEGVAAGSEVLLDRGVLTGFLTNRETAAAVGRRSNGTARADSWGTIPLIRMNNVNLQPGPDPDADRASLVAGTDDGFLFLTNRSWSIDDRRLNFQFGCEAAYEVRGGELGRLYRNPTYAGSGPDFWRSCDALGGARDWTVWGVPNCGKGQPGQVSRVAHGAPTGRFRATVGVR